MEGFFSALKLDDSSFWTFCVLGIPPHSLCGTLFLRSGLSCFLPLLILLWRDAELLFE